MKSLDNTLKKYLSNSGTTPLQPVLPVMPTNYNQLTYSNLNSQQKFYSPMEIATLYQTQQNYLAGGLQFTNNLPIISNPPSYSASVSMVRNY